MKIIRTYFINIIIFSLSILVIILNINFSSFSCLAFNNLVPYEGEIEHIFTHCLIAFPDIAFDANNSMKKYYRQDCLTCDEFEKVLLLLYKNNYILINANSIFYEKNGLIFKNKLYLPKGKKPLIFSFDDVNYDHKKIGKGMVDKLMIQDNKIVSCTTVNGNKNISNRNEFIPLLNSFIEKHPDFSFQGARGMLCLTGYDGILGYRTQRDSPNREQEIINAKSVINLLKQQGWYFACHSYGHYHMKSISDEKFKSEVEKWNNEVATLVGKTKIYVYPYGEWEILRDGKISSKHKILVDNGYKLFCGVGLAPFMNFLPKNFPKNDQILFMDRKNIDGFTLKNRKKELQGLFNFETI